MTQKRLNAFILLGVLLLYIITLGISYKNCESLTDDRFSSSAHNDCQSIFSNISLIADNEKSNDKIDMESIIHSACNYSQINYPFIVVAYNKSGEIVAKTDCYLFCSEFDKGVPLKNLSSQNKNKINKFYDKHKGFVEPYKLDYIIVDDEIIPCVIYLKSVNQNDSIRIVLRDSVKPNKTVITDSNNSKITMSLFLYNMDNSKIKKSEFQKLSRYVEAEQQISDAQNAIKNQEYLDFVDSEGNIYCENGIEKYKIIKRNNEIYYILFKFSHNIFYDSITSYEFRYSFFLQSVLFSITTILFLIVANLLFKKSKDVASTKEAFTSAAAHELKTPLAIIQNQCEFLIEDIAPEKSKEYISSIYDESLKMNKLVARLLQYNRLVSATKITKQEINLSEIVSEEIEKYSQLRKIDYDIIDNAIINANEDLIALGIDNYLSNAVRYSTGDISVTLRQTAGGYRFSVFNECEPIKKEHEKDIWEVFCKADKARAGNTSSTGIGLAICKQIFTLHKYEYGFNNYPSGVEFYFTAK